MSVQETPSTTAPLSVKGRAAKQPRRPGRPTLRGALLAGVRCGSATTTHSAQVGAWYEGLTVYFAHHASRHRSRSVIRNTNYDYRAKCGRKGG